jgi:uncharacterized protein
VLIEKSKNQRKNQIMYSSDYFISKLGLEPHIEGGYFKETYRNSFEIPDDEYPMDFVGKRALSSIIYFLLESGQVSKFHKLKFDEIWFHHYGCPILIHIIDENGEYHTETLGLNLIAGEKPQVLLPAGVIFGAELLDENSFSLVSCLVSPGFDFRDFELFSQENLSLLYPEHTEIIKKLHGK